LAKNSVTYFMDGTLFDLANASSSQRLIWTPLSRSSHSFPSRSLCVTFDRLSFLYYRHLLSSAVLYRCWLYNLEWAHCGSTIANSPWGHVLL